MKRLAFTLILVAMPAVCWGDAEVDAGAVVDAVDTGAAVTAGTMAAVDELQQTFNIIWVLLAAALVFIMQAGFMCVESGLARAKNSINVAIKNMADLLISVAMFGAFGFRIMFGVSKLGLFGTTDFLVEIGENPWFAAFFVFQAVFSVRRLRSTRVRLPNELGLATIF